MLENCPPNKRAEAVPPPSRVETPAKGKHRLFPAPRARDCRLFLASAATPAADPAEQPPAQRRKASDAPNLFLQMHAGSVSVVETTPYGTATSSTNYTYTAP
jgi:hypothetical protein